MPKDMPKDAVVGAGIDVGSNSIRLIIALAGLKIYQVFLELTGQDRLFVSDTGLLEGILLSCMS